MPLTPRLCDPSICFSQSSREHSEGTTWLSSTLRSEPITSRGRKIIQVTLVLNVQRALYCTAKPSCMNSLEPPQKSLKHVNVVLTRLHSVRSCTDKKWPLSPFEAAATSPLNFPTLFLPRTTTPPSTTTTVSARSSTQTLQSCLLLEESIDN